MFINARSPQIVGNRGGDVVTLGGLFPTLTALRVHMGTVPCYSGVSGRGFDIFSTDGATLKFVTPEIDSGGCESVLVSSASEFAESGLTVIERNFGSVPFGMRRNFPPFYAVGPRRLVLEPNQQFGEEAMASDPLWNYLPLRQPTGVAAAPAMLHQFDGTAGQLLDRTPNGVDLSLITGFEAKAKHNSTVGLRLSGERFEGPVIPAIQLTGALTIEVVVHFGDISTTSDILISCGTAGIDPPNNITWMLYIEALTGNLVFYSENGAGTADNVPLSLLVLSGQIQHLAVTRNGSTGLLSFYQNGLLIGTIASTLSTDGENGFLIIGSQFGGSMNYHGVIFSDKLTAAEFTNAQVQESYKRVRGLIA